MKHTITMPIAQSALRTFFGNSIEGNVFRGFELLTEAGLAARFRSRALELHPDRAIALDRPVEELEQEFKQLHGAYRVLGEIMSDEALRQRLIATIPASTSGAVPTRRSPVGRAPVDRPVKFTEATAGQSAAPETWFHTGSVPASRLRLAQFLYYGRVIDWRTMIDAITWQFRVRPKVGEIGRAYRFLDFDSVSRVLRDSRGNEFFGATALKLGVLDRKQLSVVLGKQSLLNYPIGRYFLENEILSRPELELLIAQNRRHNARFQPA